MSREPRDKWQYPGTKPSEGTQIIVSYNEDWLPIVSGVLFHLAHKSIWEDAPDDILEEVADLQYRLETPVQVPAFPTHQLILPPQMQIVAGVDLEIIINTGNIFNGLWHRSTPNINDAMLIKFPLAAGDYILEYCYAKSSGSGIMNIGCAALGYSENIDHYNATTQLNRIFTDTFTNDENQVLELGMEVFNKNASSSGYVQNWSYLAIRPA